MISEVTLVELKMATTSKQVAAVVTPEPDLPRRMRGALIRSMLDRGYVRIHTHKHKQFMGAKRLVFKLRKTTECDNFEQVAKMRAITATHAPFAAVGLTPVSSLLLHNHTYQFVFHPSLATTARSELPMIGTLERLARRAEAKERARDAASSSSGDGDYSAAGVDSDGSMYSASDESYEDEVFCSDSGDDGDDGDDDDDDDDEFDDGKCESDRRWKARLHEMMLALADELSDNDEENDDDVDANSKSAKVKRSSKRSASKAANKKKKQQQQLMKRK
ncbi:uncharacterized protein AMSG_00591 [Thecamonas trahens ATCC 50062]|uniref:Uncharacterized protein n=1 Tax=Thecamonas trahens ATCC 50062 TaxID=461836 RepID=A0A0L0D995_THETB|nr:hypothetical protein AMSG_00591 [Thecamonas trahens ATCC 50062]KNC48810.1 hypothetical protein AMSG_00591 [Thecamonas trahens ATCC 50062]|eukprot:XP_013762861.1 hypothetical protein AMSG_00591 [Thecamonas trahens ATCC 50062]